MNVVITHPVPDENLRVLAYPRWGVPAGEGLLVEMAFLNARVGEQLHTRMQKKVGGDWVPVPIGVGGKWVGLSTGRMSIVIPYPEVAGEYRVEFWVTNSLPPFGSSYTAGFTFVAIDPPGGAPGWGPAAAV